MGSGSFIPWPQHPYPEGCCHILEPLCDDAAILASRTEPKAFPRRGWNPDLLALSVLAEFSRQDWRKRISFAPPHGIGSKQMEAEVAHLVRLWRDERKGRVAEILHQNTQFHDFFAHLLMITPISHLETFCLFKAGARVAEMLMVSYKLDFEAPRPQQVYPLLLPLLDAPGHSSYPSGHALISRMIALCLCDVAPFAKPALLVLADRIGENREVAGIHFPSDTAAGKEIADQAFPILQSCAGYQAILERAKQEWLDSRPPA